MGKVRFRLKYGIEQDITAIADEIEFGGPGRAFVNPVWSDGYDDSDKIPYYTEAGIDLFHVTVLEELND